MRRGDGITDVNDSLHAPGPVLAEVTDVVHVGSSLGYHPATEILCDEFVR